LNFNYHFSHARTALKYGLIQLGFKPGDFILLPEYICDVVLHPMELLGLKYNFYPVNDVLEPNWDELPSFLNKHTKAIMMVHYFGQPQDISAFQSFSNEYNLLLIEDNAHGHGGHVGGKRLGTFGDMGIGSPRKLLNTYSGGVLYIKDCKLHSPLGLSAYPVSLIHGVKKLVGLIPLLKQRLNKVFLSRPNYEDPRAFREQVLGDYLIDKNSKEKIKHINWEILQKKRRSTYHRWQEFAKKNGLKPVFSDLHPGANPLCFPAYVSDHSEAVKWFDWGWKNNEYIFSWPALPEIIINENKNGMNLWKKIICFGC